MARPLNGRNMVYNSLTTLILLPIQQWSFLSYILLLGIPFGAEVVQKLAVIEDRYLVS